MIFYIESILIFYVLISYNNVDINILRFDTFRTNKAMGGNVSFREALEERLKIVQPTRQKVSDFISQHPPQFTPGIK